MSASSEEKKHWRVLTKLDGFNFPSEPSLQGDDLVAFGRAIIGRSSWRVAKQEQLTASIAAIFDTADCVYKTRPGASLDTTFYDDVAKKSGKSKSKDHTTIRQIISIFTDGLKRAAATSQNLVRVSRSSVTAAVKVALWIELTENILIHITTADNVLVPSSPQRPTDSFKNQNDNELALRIAEINSLKTERDRIQQEANAHKGQLLAARAERDQALEESKKHAAQLLSAQERLGEFWDFEEGEENPAQLQAQRDEARKELQSALEAQELAAEVQMLANIDEINRNERREAEHKAEAIAKEIKIEKLTKDLETAYRQRNAAREEATALRRQADEGESGRKAELLKLREAEQKAETISKDLETARAELATAQKEAEAELLLKLQETEQKLEEMVNDLETARHKRDLAMEEAAELRQRHASVNELGGHQMIEAMAKDLESARRERDVARRTVESYACAVRYMNSISKGEGNKEGDRKI